MSEIEELIKNIDEIPDKYFSFSDEFHYVGKTYMANGTVFFNGKTYEFSWNEENGIFESTIEEQK